MAPRIYLKRRKYGNIKQTYNGELFDSKLEATVCANLDMRVRAKEIKGYDRQFKVDVKINDKHICNLLVDFRLHLLDNTYELLEVKSPATMTPIYRLKAKLLKASWLLEHPDHIYTVTMG